MSARKPTLWDTIIVTMAIIGVPAGGVVFAGALLTLGGIASRGKPLNAWLFLGAFFGLAAAVYGLVGSLRILGRR